MYKLVIADDEPKITTLLSKIINWESLGFELAKVFSDGKEVIEYIKHNHVDCVLCDICMKHVSGIDVAEYVYNNSPQTNVIFLSGYQDFNFATSALKFGVENYFIKPVQIDEIKSAFENLKIKLDAAKNESEFISYYRRDMLNNLANGFYKDFSAISGMFERIQLNVTPDYACALLKIDFESPIERDAESLMNLFQNLASLNQASILAYYLMCDYNSVKYIMFSKTFSKNAFWDFSRELCQSITEISDVESAISELSCYETVLKLCDTFNSSLPAKDSDLLRKLEQSLVFDVNSGNTNDASDTLSTISKLISSLDLSQLKDYFSNLLKNIKPDLLTIIVEDNNSEQNNNLFDDYFNTLKACNTTESLLSFVNDFFIKLAIMMKDTNLQKKNILRIRNYIAHHYMEDLSLEHLAAMAYLSPTYFSRIFKSVVGQNYIDFLISCRMNKTKDLLLNTNMKIYEISDAVGYKNIRSFTKFFKSNCGMSPSEYRNKFMGGNTNG